MWQRAIERYNDKLDAIRRLLIESWTFECRPDDDTVYDGGGGRRCVCKGLARSRRRQAKGLTDRRR
jgi:hypothetical protein